NLMQRIKSISRLSSLLILAIISLSGCSRLGESIAQVLPANEVPLITAAVSQTSNSAVALKPEGFVQADMNTEYDELMLVDDLEEEMDFLDMAEYAAEIDDLNRMAAEEEVYGGDRGITALLHGEDFEMMIRDMPKEDPYITEKAELAQSFDIMEEYLVYHGYSGGTMQRPKSRRPSQRARKPAQQKPTYPNIREYLENRPN
ncbi:MAG: hypothetical protein VB814_01660, partial [Pirellulaceae bacterium]